MKHTQSEYKETRGLVSGWPLVAILMVFYFLSFVDRSLISLLVGPIQEDLELSDFQMGLLLGPAFGIFYAAMGIPIGRLLDKYSKRWLCTGLISLWGVSTSLSGVAGGFPTLFLTRLGLGAGESGLSPAAYSLIAEQVPSKNLATAYSLYTVGAFAGGGLAIIGGGWFVHALGNAPMASIPIFGELKPWQAAFILVGAITVLAAPLALFLKENVRSRAEVVVQDAPGSAYPEGLIQLMKSDPIFYLGYPFAFGSVNVIVTAFHVWTPTFMSRTYNWGIDQIGLAYGLSQGCAGVIGLLVMGWLVQRLYDRGMVDAHVRVPAIGMCISIPAMIFGILSGNPSLFLVTSSIFWGVTYTYAGYAPAALQLGTPARFRAQIGAVYITFLSVMGLFLGPTIVSFFTDSVFQDKERIGLSLVMLMVIWTPICLLALWITSRRLRQRNRSEFLPPA